MTAILGLSAFYHDAAAALLRDGRIVAAAQEERFTRRKGDARLPLNAAAYCLHEAGLHVSDLDIVAFYEKPITKFGRLLETHLATAPAGLSSWLRAMPVWLGERLWLEDTIRASLGLSKDTPILYTEHHQSHAASAFFASPFASAAILTVDGVGEWATTAIAQGRGSAITPIAELHFPHSLGLLYSAFTAYLGFRVNSGEYKVMGLAPYGTPRFAARILDEVVELKADGSLKLNLEYFDVGGRRSFASRRFHELCEGGPRPPEGPLGQREMDLARSIQDVAELAVVRMARHALEVTGERRLCMAGGVALNCVANARVLAQCPIDDLWIQPAAGDAGGALGAALAVWHEHLGQERGATTHDLMSGALLGPAYEDAEIASALAPFGAVLHAGDHEGILEATVDALVRGEVVGWFQGRMEYGPRALGSRSILADPRVLDMQSTLNLKVKFRESFRPFAPAVLREHVGKFFDMDADSPYMLLAASVRPEQRRAPAGGRQSEGGLALLQQVRSTLPAVTHVDYSARIQTVDHRNGLFHELLDRFHRRTGCPVLVNTSFNVRGEPVVCRPQEAYRCLMRTRMDALAIGNFFIHRAEQPAWTADAWHPDPD
jgi:carbamoyltransferase